MDNVIFVAIDGDDAGKLVGRAALSDNIEGLREISNRLELGNKYIKMWAEDHGGELISAGGDEANFVIPQENAQYLEELRSDYLHITELTLTIGIGSSLSEAGKALMIGKVRGKNQILPYSPDMEAEVEEIRRKTETEMAIGEEKKIGEAYFKNDCPYCKELDEGQHKDDCPYCKEYDSKKELDDCPYCKQLIEGQHKDDCPYCKQYDQQKSSELETKPENQVEPSAGPITKLPTTTDSENFAGQDMTEPDIIKPDPTKEPPIGTGVSTDSYEKNGTIVSNNNEKLEENFPSAASFKEVSTKNPPEVIMKECTQQALGEIVNKIMQEPGSTNEDKEEVKNIDSEQEAAGQDMEGNISREKGYGTSTPSDLAVGGSPEVKREDKPDLTSLVQEDIQGHSEEIKKERLIKLLADSLQELKLSKELIEQLKVSSPQLYQLYINNIKYLIEIAKVTGLAGQESELGSEQASLVPENEWEEPFPAHPDSQPKQENPATTEDGVGPGLGKLPTSATTKHVAKEPIPIGGVNPKGQMKIQDKEGNIRFINMKEPRVISSESGVPIKESKK